MDTPECWERLRDARSGVLGTVHPERGVDAVPVVYALTHGRIVIPVDRVKDKETTELQRIRNVRGDPRCVLLVDHYSDDWSDLWWVRVHASASVADPGDAPDALEALAMRYPQYAAESAVAAVVILEPSQIHGWHA